MPYGMNIYRRPKPAHVYDVVGIVSENLDYVTSTNGKRGYVTASVSPSNPLEGSGLITATTAGFATADELDEYTNQQDPKATENMQKSAALCDTVNMSIYRLLNPPVAKIENFDPTWVVRSRLTAKQGRLQELIDMMKGWWEAGVGISGHFTLLLPLGTTNVNSLNTTLFAESLSDIETLFATSFEFHPKFQKLADLLDGSPTRSLEKIVHKSNMNTNS